MSSYEKLNGSSGKYISVPASVILNTDIDYRRVVTFIYFSMKRGLDNEIDFTINSLVSWCGYVPNSNKGNINDKMTNIVKSLCSMGFITCDSIDNKVEKSYKNEYVKDYITASFNEQELYNELNNPTKRFALLWVDEIKLIMDYKILNTKNTYLNTSAILLVFAYLRMMIYRRSVSLENEYEFLKDDEYYPEAYNQFKYVIAKQLGIGEKTLREILNILQNDLKLITMEVLPRVKYENKFRTDHTIFTNYYRREGCYVVKYGEEYYQREIECKKKKLNTMKGDQ